jgi:hypothetical protein
LNASEGAWQPQPDSIKRCVVGTGDGFYLNPAGNISDLLLQANR